MVTADPAGALRHFTAVRDAVGDRGPFPLLARCLSGRSATLLTMGRIAEAAGDARRSLALAREGDYPVAVKGFTEALIVDLRASAPQVRVVLVMPGHVGTDIIANSLRARGLPAPEQMSDAQVEELIPRDAQAKLIEAGMLAGARQPMTCASCSSRGTPTSGTRRRSARPRRRPSSWTECDPGPGGSS